LVVVFVQEKGDKKITRMAQRDTYQRKAYAIRRMTLAVKRLNQATSTADRKQASYWIEMWAAISGIRQFKLNIDDRRVKKLPILQSNGNNLKEH
jgi:hypothetical protein